MVNFTVTGQGLLTLRPGVRALELPFGFDTRGQVIRGLWAGFLGRGEFLAVATSPAGEYGANGDYIQVFRRKEEGFAAAALLPRPFWGQNRLGPVFHLLRRALRPVGPGVSADF